MVRKIAFDLDGVVADYQRPYGEVLVDVTGEDRFPEGWRTDPRFPEHWDYDFAAGYTKEQRDLALRSIHEDSNFWRRLPPLPGALTVAQCPGLSGPGAEIYFMTIRAGVFVKDQTEEWCHDVLGFEFPTVLISKHKGTLCSALGIHAFIDDKPENVESVVLMAPSTKAYLLDAPWNQGRTPAGSIRVASVAEFIDREDLMYASY